MKWTCSLLLLLFCSTFAIAQTCPNQYGMGNDVPKNVTVNGVCLVDDTEVTIPSWYNNVPGSMNVCFDTTNVADTLVQLDYNVNQSYSGPTTSHQQYDSTLVTHHCLVSTGWMSGRKYLLIPASCSAAGSGGVNGLRCSRFDPNWSVAGYDQPNQKHGFVVDAPAANASHPLSYVLNTVGPTTGLVYQNDQLNVSLQGQWLDGPLPTWIHVLNPTIDSQLCAAQSSGGPCGTTGVKLLVDNNGSELFGGSSLGYNVQIAASGPYAGTFTLGGSTQGVSAYTFNLPGPLLVFFTGNVALGDHAFDADFQATDASQNPMGSPVHVHYVFNVQAQSTFAATPPSTFSPIPNESSWLSFIAGGHRFYDGFEHDNLVLGKYDNDNYSAAQSASTDAVWNYTGESVAYDLADYVPADDSYWQEKAQRVVQQRLAWASTMPKTSVWAEWNILPWGLLQYFLRTGDPNAKLALDYLANPVVFTSGYAWQPLVWAAKYPPLDTIRTLPYSIELLSATCLTHGSCPVVNGVDELARRRRLLVQTLNETRRCNPLASICEATPSFDLGLASRALVRDATVQRYLGKSVDPKVVNELLAMYDWFYATKFNQTGSDFTTPYTLNLIPGKPNGNQNLNMLLAPGLTWLRSIFGDSCVLPTKNVGCQTAADAIAVHALDLSPYGAKQFNQVLTWFDDYRRWHTGVATWEQSSVLPSFNPTIVPVDVEPFNGASWPTGYPLCTPITNGATCSWVIFKPATNVALLVAPKTGSTCGTFALAATGPAPSPIAGTINQWLASATANSLASSTSYCVEFQATDAAGKIATSGWDPLHNVYYSFTTPSGGPSQLQFALPTLPRGTQGAPYGPVFLGATGGTSPYSYALTSGSFPNGVALTGNQIAGVANQSGSFPITITATDSSNPAQHAASSGTIVVDPSQSNLTITTTKLPTGIVKKPYSTTLAASGGVPPYRWTTSNPSLDGAKLALDGVFSGVPISKGTFTLTVFVTDAADHKATAKLPWSVIGSNPISNALKAVLK